MYNADSAVKRMQKTRNGDEDACTTTKTGQRRGIFEAGYFLEVEERSKKENGILYQRYEGKS
jgi:hypothetical protein